MRLLILLNRQLSKAGREGLVPVQREVIRGGKAFRQIFYVRPSRAEAEEDAEKIQDPETFHKPPIKGGSPDNRPQGGFWIWMRDTGGEKDIKAVRVPQKHIHKVFTWAGYKFVVHRKLDMIEKRWEAKYTVTELTTGLSIGGERNADPEKAMKLGMQTLEKVGKQKLANAVQSGAEQLDKIPEENYVGETDHWDTADIVTAKARRQFVDELVQFSDEALDRNQIETWLEELYTLEETSDIDDLREEIQDQFVFERAVVYKKTYEDVLEEEKAIADMMDVTGKDYERIRDWAEKHDFDLGSYDRESWAVETTGGNEAEPQIAMDYALNADVSFEVAKEKIYDELKEEESESGYDGDSPDGEIPNKGERRAYQDFDSAKREKLLSENEVAEKAYLGGGCNGSYWIRMENGDEIEGVWKPAHEEHSGLRSNVEGGSYYLREAVAWEIDKAMDLGLIPPTVIQQIEGVWGSVQEFAGDAYTTDEKSLEDTDAIYGASVFDFLTLNTDRHNNNFMITEDGEPILIDNGLILPTNEKDLGNPFYSSYFYHSGTIPTAIIEKVRNADWSKVVNWMVDHGIEDSAVDNFTRRLAWIMDEGRLPDSGEVGFREKSPWAKYPSRGEDIMSPKEGVA